MITISQSAGKLIEMFATQSTLTSVSRLLFNNALQGNPWGKNHYFWFIFWSWYLKMISGNAKQNQALSAMMRTSEFAWMFRWPMWQSSTEQRHQVSVAAHVFRSATWYRKSRVSQEHFLNVSPSQEENVQLLKERKLDLHVTRSIWREGSSWSLNVLDFLKKQMVGSVIRPITGIKITPSPSLNEGLSSASGDHVSATCNKSLFTRVQNHL